MKRFIVNYVFDRKWALLYVSIIFALSLIPLLYITRFSHPSADDFSYGNHTVHVWRETGSVTRLLSAAAEGTRGVYNSWQGSFAAVFVMTLHPAVFNESLYMFGPMLMLLGFVAATMFLLKVIMMDCLGMDKYACGIITVVFTFISVQFIFCPVEGFYWYNSALYYTGFHSLSLLLFSFILLSIRSENRRAVIIYTIAVPLIAFLVGGSNFVTALISTSIMALITMYCVIVKRGKWLAPSLGLIMICIALVISVTAPGNAVRQVHFTSMDPLLAIVRSFEYAFHFISLVIRAPIWLGFVALIPIIYGSLRNCAFRFRYPVWVVIVMYGIYASTFTPNLYSWSSYGPARVVNINFFAFLFFLLFSIIYICGSIASYSNQKTQLTSRVRSKKTRQSSVIENPIITAVLALAFLTVCVHALIRDTNSMTSISAAGSLITGEARTFHEENLTRREILLNPNIRDAELLEFSVKPRVLFHTLDITPDPTVWPNTSLADFYNKDSVTLIPRKP
ncbi:MAG: DUF6056 family protein [Defluviitaleaceae bacterium]|nr:DUF6056 family protein [Defluviitaleaceae bacterium]